MKRLVVQINDLLKMVRKISGILIFISLSLTGISQQAGNMSREQNCEALLRAADEFFQNGYYENCARTVEKILGNCKLTRNEKLHMLELLAKSRIETGDQVKAESAVNQILKNFPHYELKENENPELFNRMIRKYEIHPLLTIGAKNTGNFLRHRFIKTYSVLDGLDYGRPINESGYWFTYYGFAEYEFVKDISVSIDGMVFWSAYTRNLTKDPSFSLNYREEDDFLEFPVYLKKYFHPAGNFLVYVSAGLGPFINYRATGSITLSYKKEDLITGKDADFEGTLNNIDVLPLNNKLTGQWNIGIGFGYTLKNLRFFLDARYLSLTGSFTDPVKSDKIPELKNEYFFINNEINITQFEVGATISYTLFNSVKRLRK